MTAVEIEYEKGYRYFERLGIMCEDEQPTLSQMFLAQQEGEDWERQWRQEHPLEK